MDVRAPRRFVSLVAIALVVASVVVEGLSTPFTWPARLATGVLIAWGLGVARPWSMTDGRVHVGWQALAATLAVATVFTLVEVVELVHGPREQYPTFSSILEDVLVRTTVGGVELGRSVLAAAWVALGRWLLAP